MEAEVHAVDEVGEVVDEVLLNGRVGGVHVEQVLVPRLGGLEPGLVVLELPLLELLLDDAQPLVLRPLLLGHGRVQLVALLLHDLQLVLGLPELGLVRLVRLHGGVKLVQHLQHLLVDLVADLATLTDRKEEVVDKMLV